MGRIDNNTTLLAVGFKPSIPSFQLFERTSDTALIVASSVSQSHCSALSNEQGLPNTNFKQSHFMADSGLRNPKFFRRLAEAFKSSSSFKAQKVLQGWNIAKASHMNGIHV